jgi:hypothetical protein
MPVPDYSAGVSKVDPLGAMSKIMALQKAQQTAGMDQMRQNLMNIQTQLGQQNLLLNPAKFQLAVKEASAKIAEAHQHIEQEKANTLNQYTQAQLGGLKVSDAQNTLIHNKMAEVYEAPDDQKDAVYQQNRSWLLKNGAATADQLPEKLTPDQKEKLQISYNVAPETKDIRDQQNRLAAAQINMQTQAQIGLQKIQQSAAAARATALTSDESKELVDYEKTSIAQAKTARPLLTDVQSIDKLAQTYHDSGLLKQKTFWATPEGQELNQRINSVAGLWMQTFKSSSRMGSRAIDQLQDMKMKMYMQPEAVSEIAKFLSIDPTRTIENEKFFNELRTRGLTAGEIDGAFHDYEDEYSPIDDKGHPIPKNLNRWSEFLSKHANEYQPTSLAPVSVGAIGSSASQGMPSQSTGAGSSQSNNPITFPKGTIVIPIG